MDEEEEEILITFGVEPEDDWENLELDKLSLVRPPSLPLFPFPPLSRR